MTELVTAVFDTPAKAEAAVQDLNVARIPSAVVQRGTGNSVSGAKPGVWMSCVTWSA